MCRLNLNDASSATPVAVRPGSLGAWRVASRPPSLLLAIGPVLSGAALAYARTGAMDTWVLGVALFAAVLMQLITNLQNDVGYTARGAEHDGLRVGLPRATAMGWLSLVQVRLVVVLLCLFASMFGLALVVWRGWPVLAIGAASLAAALGYMGGKRPIAYRPVGELVAFLFFGPVAVMGTDWLLTGSTALCSGLASLALGSLAAAALAINNHRDRVHDQTTGRRTFAVVWGEAASRRLVHWLVQAPFMVVIGMALAGWSPWLLLPLILVRNAWCLLREFDRSNAGVALNAVLSQMFRTALWFAVLLALGAALSRWLA